jgi:hypothetical protein
VLAGLDAMISDADSQACVVSGRTRQSRPPLHAQDRRVLWVIQAVDIPVEGIDKRYCSRLRDEELLKL